MDIIVRAKALKLEIGIYSYRCAIGKNGYIDHELGREGDGKTPLGRYPVRFGYYRHDRLGQYEEVFETPELIFHPTRPDHGWCDDPDDPAYNRPVTLPYHTSAERLYRDSAVYDIVLVLGHNDDPPIGGKQALGSAIFLHIARENYLPTQGCVALSRSDMLDLIPKIKRGSMVDIIE